MANHLYRQAFVDDKVDQDSLKKLNSFIKERLTPTVQTDYKIWQPFHWPLEFPEVFEHGGFDAIIGNPPFLVAKKISAASGNNFRNFISNFITKKVGQVDLVAFFFFRASQVIRDSGTIGLIGAKAIREGETGEIGLGQILMKGFSIYSAWNNRLWPSRSASTNIAIVWMTRSQRNTLSVLNGLSISGIDHMLNDRTYKLERGHKLDRKNKLSNGVYFYGDGFIISKDQRDVIVTNYPSEKELIFPFVNGSNLNSSIAQDHNQFIINFFEMSKIEAEKYPQCLSIVEKLVKPEREKLDKDKYSRFVENWWIYRQPCVELIKNTFNVSDVIGLSVVSTYLVPVVVKSGPIFSSAVVVWPHEDRALFALLSSWQHRSWAQWWGSGMRNDSRYVISDCYETFPFPGRSENLNELGKSLDLLQKDLKLKRQIGITNLYKLFHNPAIMDQDIVELRELHKNIDQELHFLYGFDFELSKYEFSEFKNLVQYGPNKDDRIRILQGLLAENKRQHEGEVIKWPL
jgi:hypothetical protein